MTVTVAVDAMGGDVGLNVTIPASIHFLEDHPSVHLVLVGDVAAIAARLSGYSMPLRERIRIQNASEVVGMDESPVLALKNKKDSSMRVALNLLKEGSVQAVVSAGNTGALMATARFVLKTIPGIDRPAIAKLMPSMRGVTCMLDLGANVDCTPEQLLQFGMMGSAFFSCRQDKQNPTVGLLNIGSEEMKGNENVRLAAELFKASELNFYGNVEGNDIYKGTVDVVVCDGFIGNVALKTAEGLAQMISLFLQEGFRRTWWSRLCALAALPVLRQFRRRVDPRRYNGASFLGLNGIVVKSHGGTDEVGFRCALEQAFDEVGSDVIGHIAQQVTHHIKQSQVK